MLNTGWLLTCNMGGYLYRVVFMFLYVFVALILFHILVLRDNSVLTESRIPLKPVLGGVRIVALSISSTDSIKPSLLFECCRLSLSARLFVIILCA